jgi:PAS domain S-box-containing protein
MNLRVHRFVSFTSELSVVKKFERSWLLRYGFVVAAILVSLLLRLALTPVLGPTALPFLFFYPPIVFSAWLGRFRMATVAIVLSVLASEYFFFDPVTAIRIDEVVGLAGFICVSLLMIVAVDRMHQANDRLHHALQRTKQSEQALKESEGLFRTLLNTANQSVWHYRRGGVPIEQIDRAAVQWWCEFTGQTENERAGGEGTGWLDVVHPDDQASARQIWADVIAIKQPVQRSFRVRRKDGEWRWLSIHGVPVSKDGEDEVIGTATDVTEQVSAEGARRDKETELKLIINRTPFMLTRCSSDLRYLFVSPAYAEMLDRPATEIAGKPISEVIGDEGLATILPYIRRVLTGETVEYQTEVQFRGVGARMLHVIYSPETNAQREVTGWIASIRDITENQRTQYSLSESLRREQVLFQFVAHLHRAESPSMVYETALDSILSGLRCDRASILLFDEAGVMKFVASRGLSNEYIHAVEGHSPWTQDDLDAQPISITDIATADLDEHLRAVISEEGIRALNFIPLITARRLIGKFMFYYDKPHVCSSEELELSLNIGRQLAFSISRMRTDVALKENEERLRLATQIGKVGIWEWNIALDRVLWSDSLYRIHGVDPQNFDGTVEAFAALVHPADKELVQTAIARSVHDGEPYELEFRVVRPDGEIAWVFTNAVVLHDGDSSRMLGATLDITERKRAEADKEWLLAREQKLRLEAEESNRVKDEFLAIMSHELRNPLNVMVGYSELLVRANEIANSPHLLKMADTIKRSANTQAKLIHDLIDLSRLRSGKLELEREVVSVIASVNSAVDTVRREAAEKQIRIEVNAADESALVNADPIRLQQIVWNLLNNAVKFTPHGGTVGVSISSRNGDVTLRVKDDGQGIHSNFLPHVFEIFRQADSGTTRSQAGMGIGLAVVKQLVELHDGNVSVASEGLGKGSEFTVTLPSSKQVFTPQTSSIDLKALNDVRVLILDDSEDTVEMLRFLLGASGASVTAVTSGVDALRIASESDFDAVVSDISMPGMDGFEFLRQLKLSSRNMTVPVVALTGFGRTEDIERVRDAGFCSHLTKPLDVYLLVETLRKVARSNDVPAKHSTSTFEASS